MARFPTTLVAAILISGSAFFRSFEDRCCNASIDQIRPESTDRSCESSDNAASGKQDGQRDCQNLGKSCLTRLEWTVRSGPSVLSESMIRGRTPCSHIALRYSSLNGARDASAFNTPSRYRMVCLRYWLGPLFADGLHGRRLILGQSCSRIRPTTSQLLHLTCVQMFLSMPCTAALDCMSVHCCLLQVRFVHHKIR